MDSYLSFFANLLSPHALLLFAYQPSLFQKLVGSCPQGVKSIDETCALSSQAILRRQLAEGEDSSTNCKKVREKVNSTDFRIVNFAIFQQKTIFDI